MDYKKDKKDATLEDTFRYQIQWFLFNIIAAPSIIVTAFDWGWLYYYISEKIPTLLYVSIHLLPNVVCLIEIYLTLIVVRFVHVVYPSLFLITYLLFLVIYWASGGTNPFGSPFVYETLDFENSPGIVVAFVVVFTVSTLLLQAILKGLYALRVRCMDSKRTAEAVPSTEELSAVELEALTG
ncbi:protein rolling stone-like [Diadema antillarum]|uniref:protein rolling stone-like n=1 Tax=Diadema antillarum TaxID=105358 RepID=UPI003A85009E